MPKLKLGHDLESVERTEDVSLPENDNTDFKLMLLPEYILGGLHLAGYYKPSPIQLKAIPLALCGFDLIVQAKSGTGKTLVFTVAALENFCRESNKLQAIILAPTREIAQQIQNVISVVGCNLPNLGVETFIGGIPLKNDIERLKACHIAVGSPGRLKHLIKTGYLKTDAIRLIVLDEADKLMEGCFIKDINYIFNKLPPSKQVIACSATYTQDMMDFLGDFMQNTTHVQPDQKPSPMLLGLRHFVTFEPMTLNSLVRFKYKEQALLKILCNVSFLQCIIFTNNSSRAESISNFLQKNNWNALWIAGYLDQNLRTEVIAKMKKMKIRILVTTDLTARGIDIFNANMVINLDVPEHNTYLHRMGRAGRFGGQGLVITVLTKDERSKFETMLHKLKNGTNAYAFIVPESKFSDKLWTCDLSKFEQVGVNNESDCSSFCGLSDCSSNISQGWVKVTAEGEEERNNELESDSIVADEQENGNRIQTYCFGSITADEDEDEYALKTCSSEEKSSDEEEDENDLESFYSEEISADEEKEGNKSLKFHYSEGTQAYKEEVVENELKNGCKVVVPKINKEEFEINKEVDPDCSEEIEGIQTFENENKNSYKVVVPGFKEAEDKINKELDPDVLKGIKGIQAYKEEVVENKCKNSNKVVMPGIIKAEDTIVRELDSDCSDEIAAYGKKLLNFKSYAASQKFNFDGLKQIPLNYCILDENKSKHVPSDSYILPDQVCKVLQPCCNVSFSDIDDLYNLVHKKHKKYLSLVKKIPSSKLLNQMKTSIDLYKKFFYKLLVLELEKRKEPKNKNDQNQNMVDEILNDKLEDNVNNPLLLYGESVNSIKNDYKKNINSSNTKNVFRQKRKKISDQSDSSLEVDKSERKTKKKEIKKSKKVKINKTDKNSHSSNFNPKKISKINHMDNMNSYEKSYLNEAPENPKAALSFQQVNLYDDDDDDDDESYGSAKHHNNNDNGDDCQQHNDVNCDNYNIKNQPNYVGDGTADQQHNCVDDGVYDDANYWTVDDQQQQNYGDLYDDDDHHHQPNDGDFYSYNNDDDDDYKVPNENQSSQIYSTNIPNEVQNWYDMWYKQVALVQHYNEFRKYFSSKIGTN